MNILGQVILKDINYCLIQSYLYDPISTKNLRSEYIYYNKHIGNSIDIGMFCDETYYFIINGKCYRSFDIEKIYSLLTKYTSYVYCFGSDGYKTYNFDIVNNTFLFKLIEHYINHNKYEDSYYILAR